MVKRLHRAGIEVILDVVYNHTGEGDHTGPTLAFRGIDNASYYRLDPKDPRRYVDFTGCGNTLNMLHPRTLQLIMDSLRYWVLDMHVDGFRFDLAPALARELYEMERLGTFFDIIQQDPVLSQVKLIAEPWDLGPGGYQVGNFPGGWAEWNGRYRDTVRRFWRGDAGQLAALGYRLTGSSDLYGSSGRNPYASINFVTCHDGFTLADLVGYEHKHNEDNGEGGADGAPENFSANWGVEGPTDEPGVLAVRDRARRNFMATLALSQGVPMVLAGDEMGRTQRGNNNAYCHDDERSWVDWSLPPRERAFLEFTRGVLRLRQENPVLRRRCFFSGTVPGGTRDVDWLCPEGRTMTEQDWIAPDAHALAMLIHGEASDERDERGRPIAGHSLLLCLNGGATPRAFTLPHLDAPGGWREVVDTARAGDRGPVGDTMQVVAYSLVLLRWEPGP
jgi:glycogen operon protein